MKKEGLKRIAYVMWMILAIACVVVGAMNVWKAFSDFDEYTLSEKDTQFDKIITTDDASIQVSFNTFIRESKDLFGRDRLKRAQEEWLLNDDKTSLKSMLETASMRENPVFSGFAVFRKGKAVKGLPGGYEFITKANDRGIRVCRDYSNCYHLAYEYEAEDKVTYYTIMDLEALYSGVLTSTEGSTDSLFLMDSSGTVAVYRIGEENIISIVGEETNSNYNACISMIKDSLQSDKKVGKSLNLVNGNGEDYTVRMVVSPSAATDNGEFAIGIMANYEKAVAPSKAAARRILTFGGIAFAGVAIIFVLMVLLRIKTSAEMDNLRKRNEVMGEINRKMQVLAHHQRLETIGTMTAGIAHDFNNLLTPIMGYSMMTMEMLPADQTELQDNLMEVYNASVKAKDMVSRLAELSKKSDESAFTDNEPDELVQSVLKVTIPAKPKSVEVKVSFNSENCLVRGDRTQLSQLIMNLILNAYDAMGEGGGTLLISTEAEDSDVVMRFRDNGPGMDAETVARIFDPFYTTKESGKGTGLGLAIVAQIAEMHNARVYVDSTVGEGTEFKVVFPAKKQ